MVELSGSLVWRPSKEPTSKTGGRWLVANAALISLVGAKDRRFGGLSKVVELLLSMDSFVWYLMGFDGVGWIQGCVARKASD